MKYSIVVPAKNEQDSVKPLFEAVKAVMQSLPGDAHSANGSNGPQWEMIVVDDGSDDQTLARLIELRKQDARVKIIRFRRSFGQTAAWSAGFDKALGDYVIVHVGFAISRLNEREAQSTFEYLKEINELAELENS